MTIDPDPAKAIPGSYMRAPCGCQTWTQWKHPAAFCADHQLAECAAFICLPCRLSCPNYRHVLAVSAAEGKRVDFRPAL